MSRGKERRWWLAYPLACMALTLPCVFLLYNSSALFQVWAAGASALAGGLLGIVLRRKEKTEKPGTKPPPSPSQQAKEAVLL